MKNTKGEKMKAYHFLRNDMTSSSGNEPAWKVGEERTYEGEIIICKSGYHSSPSWYDCLTYAQGNIACIVEISEPIDKQKDKYVSRIRKLVDCRNAEKVLRTWACDCAERALKHGKITDKCSWNTVRISRLYNDGKATKEELAAAWAAARDDARVAALAAAWAAARDDARVAALAAAWAVARDDAWDAARAVARDTARAVARDDAWAVAGDAEISWQRKHLDKLMEELFNEPRRIS